MVGGAATQGLGLGRVRQSSSVAGCHVDPHRQRAWATTLCQAAWGRPGSTAMASSRDPRHDPCHHGTLQYGSHLCLSWPKTVPWSWSDRWIHEVDRKPQNDKLCFNFYAIIVSCISYFKVIKFFNNKFSKTSIFDFFYNYIFGIQRS